MAGEELHVPTCRGQQRREASATVRFHVAAVGPRRVAGDAEAVDARDEVEARHGRADPGAAPPRLQSCSEDRAQTDDQFSIARRRHREPRAIHQHVVAWERAAPGPGLHREANAFASGFVHVPCFDDQAAAMAVTADHDELCRSIQLVSGRVDGMHAQHRARAVAARDLLLQYLQRRSLAVQERWLERLASDRSPRRTLPEHSLVVPLLRSGQQQVVVAGLDFAFAMRGGEP